jgi:integrase
MPVRKRLTDAIIADLPVRKKRYLVWDVEVPSLAVRVGKARKTFVLVTRFGKCTSRKSVGLVSRITVEQARGRARRLLTQLAGETDTHITFSEVLDKLVDAMSDNRYARELERVLRRDVAAWMKKPIASIARKDVIAALDTRRRQRSNRRHGSATTVSAAHHLLSYSRRVFNFAVARDIIEHAPTDRLRSQDIVGAKAIRTRVLTDTELRTVWNAAHERDYRDAIQLLMLTGCRRSEIAAARIREVNIIDRTLTLSADRTKSSAAHVVYLAPTALRIVAQRLAQSDTEVSGNFLFGRELLGFGKISKHLNQGLDHFTLHDLRRTFRTRLASLRVPEHIAEAAIGHSKKSLQRIYNQWQYASELRDAFDAWHDELLRIVRQPARAENPALELVP